MSSILDKIIEQTSSDLKKRQQKHSIKDFESFEGYEKSRNSFKDALRVPADVSVIAEVKKASPSKGIIREDFDPLSIALQYEDAGAAAISVLTDEPFFKGHLSYLEAISKRVSVPTLRKDFIIDPYQIAEAKAHGADAVLIIVTITNGEQLEELLHATKEYGLHALVECYSQKDFNRVDFNLVDILGVNNRDLNTFEVDVHRGISILNQAPEKTIKVSESGLYTSEDLFTLFEHQLDAALIGESLMRETHPGTALKQLKQGLITAIEEKEGV